MNKFLNINHHIIYLYIMHFLLLHIYKNVYIYSKEIKCLVITSNNAPVVK